MFQNIIKAALSILVNVISVVGGNPSPRMHTEMAILLCTIGLLSGASVALMFERRLLSDFLEQKMLRDTVTVWRAVSTMISDELQTAHAPPARASGATLAHR